MKKYIKINVRTKGETVNWRIGEHILDSLCEFQGNLLPEQISHNPDKFDAPFLGKKCVENFWATPVTLSYGGGTFEVADTFAWRRKKSVKSLGYVTHTKRNIKSQIVPGEISFTSDYASKVNFYELFKSWCCILPPQIGMLHLFVEEELKDLGRYDSFRLGSFNASLNPEICGIGWAMYYGPDFCKNIDIQKLEESGFFVEKIGDGFIVRVTQNIADVNDNFAIFSERREEMRKLFPQNFFKGEDDE